MNNDEENKDGNVINGILCEKVNFNFDIIFRVHETLHISENIYLQFSYQCFQMGLEACN